MLPSRQNSNLRYASISRQEVDPMTPSLAANIGVLISVLIVLGTIVGELRERVVNAATLWVRPAILGAVTVALASLSARLAPNEIAFLIAYLAGGVAIGAALGWLILRLTTFSAAGNLNSLQVRGSAITVAIWLAFIAARLAVRFISPNLPIIGLDSSAASTAVIATAFVVLATAFRNTIRLQRVKA
jgi:hypothetical protein